MQLYRLDARQLLATDIETAWRFFSNPANLSLITPPEMGFRITAELPAEMYPGMMITYRVKPLLGIEVSWATEITQINPHHYFADDQRFGPYSIWHHEHHFETVAGGVLATDCVHYALPLDPFSRPVAELLVRPQLERIFRFRQRALEEKFGILDEGDASPLRIHAL